MEPPVPAEIAALREDIIRNTALIDHLALLRLLKDLQDTWFAQQEDFVLPHLVRPQKRAPRSASLVAGWALLLPVASTILTL